MGLAAKLVSISELSDDDRQQMLALMQRHYRSVQPECFAADLREKLWVIQVRDSQYGELRGFSTQMVLHCKCGDRPIRAIFSGDTIIDRGFWGDPALIRGALQLALSLLEESQDELYWFLISQGYKTYRYLPLIFREFYPRHDTRTPGHLQEVIDALAESKYSEWYDSASGVIRAHAGQYCLREGIAEITPERLRDPHVRFFVNQNPAHKRGDELCCIARISRENLTPAALRVLRQ